MKRSTKALLMAALCMFIVGCGFCIAAVCMGFSGVQFLQAVESGQMQLIPEMLDRTNESSESHTKSAAGQYCQTFTEIEELELNLSTAECTIVLWDEDEIQVSADRIPESFSCVQEGKTLLIDCEKEKRNLWKENAAVQLTLYLPADTCFRNVELGTGIGTVEVQEGFLKCRELELDSGVGQCWIQADITERIRIDGGVGEVDLQLKGRETDFNYELDNGIGEIVIGETHLEKLGEDRWIDHNASKDVEIDNGIGNIMITFIEDEK